MAIKLLGLGCKEYWSDSWNVLDGTIVSLSIFEMLMTALASGTGSCLRSTFPLAFSGHASSHTNAEGTM